MNRILAMMMLCILMVACGSDNSSRDPNDTVNPQANSDLNPTAMALDAPPTNGKLPAELLPPA